MENSAAKIAGWAGRRATCQRDHSVPPQSSMPLPGHIPDIRSYTETEQRAIVKAWRRFDELGICSLEGELSEAIGAIALIVAQESVAAKSNETPEGGSTWVERLFRGPARSTEDIARPIKTDLATTAGIDGNRGHWQVACEYPRVMKRSLAVIAILAARKESQARRKQKERRKRRRKGLARRRERRARLA